MTFFDNFSSFQLIAAHRGFRAHYPENSLAAFIASKGRCHFIELDVQISKDLIPVVIHDETLERTTNAQEKDAHLGLKSLQVDDWTVSELKTLDIGSWFLETDPFGTISRQEAPSEQLRRMLPQRLMTLEEVLLHPSLQKMPINIEIKDHSGKKINTQVTECVLEVVQKSKAVQRVLISSFNHDYLVIAKNCASSVSTAALQERSHPKNLVDYLQALGVAAYHPSDDITDACLIKKLRAAGLGINVFTVNSNTRKQDLFSMGATAVITDYPKLS